MILNAKNLLESAILVSERHFRGSHIRHDLRPQQPRNVPNGPTETTKSLQITQSTRKRVILGNKAAHSFFPFSRGVTETW